MVNANIVTMTIWTPDLSGREGPVYKAIADAIAEGARDGTLAPGSRLPTHRDLAHRLGVTVATITRAYQEARRRGLVHGEVGRGTFVQPPPTASASFRHATEAELDQAPAGPIDLSLNFPVLDGHANVLSHTLAELAQEADLTALLRYQPDQGLPRHREVGATWLARSGVVVRAEEVTVTAGAHHAMACALAAVCRAGDVVLVEELTFPGVRALAEQMGLILHGVAMDSEGLIPEALQAACAATGARTLYTVPTLQNPTGAIMPEARRRQIADVAAAHDLTVLEDDVYAMLPARPQTPLAALIPERTIYFTSVSKTLAPGLRVGFAAAPRHLTPYLAAAVRTSLWMTPPLMVEVACRWITSGTAETLIARTRRELARRRDLADRLLIAPTGMSCDTPRDSAHLWLKLPEGWQVGQFVEDARRVGIILRSPDVFTVGRTRVSDHIRLCPGAEPDMGRYREALNRLAGLLRHGPASLQPVL